MGKGGWGMGGDGGGRKWVKSGKAVYSDLAFLLDYGRRLVESCHEWLVVERGMQRGGGGVFPPTYFNIRFRDLGTMAAWHAPWSGMGAPSRDVYGRDGAQGEGGVEGRLGGWAADWSVEPDLPRGGGRVMFGLRM